MKEINARSERNRLMIRIEVEAIDGRRPKNQMGNGKEFRGEDRYVEKDERNKLSNEWKS